ncbi:MAG: hypothetical protein ABSG15_08990 [FCB group bacterium]
MEITTDCFTGWEIKQNDLKVIDSATIEYTDSSSYGKIKITYEAYDEIKKGNYDIKFSLLGIARNCFDNHEEPPVFNLDFINEGIKSYNLPKSFNEKVFHCLKYLYEHGGKENYKFNFNSTMDFPVTYSDSDEFIRVVEYIEKMGWIEIKKTHPMSAFGREKIFMDVELTPDGLLEVEKSLPQIPLIGLVSQEISTGDNDIDDKIKHAKDLFFKEYSNTNDKRSACEELSYILEPLRDKLSNFFSASDVSDFFQLVNRFDVRHNKSGTINLVYEEQLEWVFYTLLNTINIYVKLSHKYLS